MHQLSVDNRKSALLATFLILVIGNKFADNFAGKYKQQIGYRYWPLY